VADLGDIQRLAEARKLRAEIDRAERVFEKLTNGSAPADESFAGAAEAFSAPIDKNTLTLAYWLQRDTPPPDFMLGELVSTSSRILMAAPTGLGKTNFVIAKGVAIAAGDRWLHWKAGESPRKVLLIDGEMPKRVLRRRLEDAVRRRGGDAPDTFFIISRDDFPDEMPPLNTEAGQKFVERFIEAIGGVDLIVFDNIQALLLGDMKDELPWQETLPWVRDLTRRNIGQIWVHHTGHDETHSYGTKTREWQLDTVILLERVEIPDTDIAFRLSFIKSRERTPENRRDYEPVLVTLAADQWTFERNGHIPSIRRTPQSRALELLKDAVAREGVIPPACSHIPPDTHCVTEDQWRRYCSLGSLSEGSGDDPGKKAEAERKAFKRAADKLIGSKVSKWENFVWIIR
jgi:hypothetical protein